jgi:Domain of unknown function (DUF4396)
MTPRFWFVMSMGLLVGFAIAYPMNWWLVANHLKHGMMGNRGFCNLNPWPGPPQGAFYKYPKRHVGWY